MVAERIRPVNSEISKGGGFFERILSSILEKFGESVAGVMFGLLAIIGLGVCLLIVVTVFLVIYKIVKWAWS